MDQIRTPLNFIMAALLSCFLAIQSAQAVAAESPRVVASIAPVHGLVARVMAGAGSPELLIAGTVSPHAYSLKPSDARLLEAADAVFWIGPELERALIKPLQVLASGATVSSLMDDRDRGVDLLARRKGGVLDHNQDEGDEHDNADSIDPHIWLNPQNGAAMMLHIAEVLSGIDPANANLYLSNAQDGAQELDALSRHIEGQLAQLGATQKPFIFFHDAFQYFEQRFGLTPIALIRVNPERASGARRIADIRTAIVQADPVCVFSEPQFEPKIISNLIENTQSIHAVLDPMGSTIAPGSGFYTAMLEAFVDDFVGCLR